MVIVLDVKEGLAEEKGFSHWPWEGKQGEEEDVPVTKEKEVVEVEEDDTVATEQEIEEVQ